MISPHEVLPGDPLVTWMVSRADFEAGPTAIPVIAAGRNVAWLGRATRPGERWVTGMGEEPAEIVRLVERLAAEHDVDGVTVPEDAFDGLPARLKSPDPGLWCLWTLPPDQARLQSSSAIRLSLDDERIDDLLAHSSSAHVFRGDPRVVRWAGIERDGRLAAVAGQIAEASGAAHLVSVCTHPDFRGRGLASQVCSRIMADAIEDGAPMLVLEMYSANESGRRVYARLGFTECGRYASGLLAPALPTVRS